MIQKLKKREPESTKESSDQSDREKIMAKSKPTKKRSKSASSDDSHVEVVAKRKAAKETKEQSKSSDDESDVEELFVVKGKSKQSEPKLSTSNGKKVNC